MRIRWLRQLTGVALAPVFLAPAAVFGDTASFTADGMFSVPPGVTQIKADLWGGGGGGGGTSDTGIDAQRGGAGGGGGGYSTAALNVTPGEILNVTVGIGGARGGGDSPEPGGDGGDSSIYRSDPLAPIIAAGGGKGGTTSNRTAPFAGGAGGTGTENGQKGGDGTRGSTNNPISSGAGGNAGHFGPGLLGGAGGAALTTENKDGNPGNAYGGGGGGGRSQDRGGKKFGGAGAGGYVAITYYPVSNILSTVVSAAPAVLVNTDSNIKVTVKNTNNSPVPNLPITLAAYPAANVTINPNPVTTDANGVAIFTFNSMAPQTVRFTASCPEGPVIGSADITIQSHPVSTPAMSVYGLMMLTGLLGLLGAWRQRPQRG